MINAFLELLIAGILLSFLTVDFINDLKNKKQKVLLPLILSE